MSKNKRRVCLLLTGCVRPNIKNDVLTVTDAETRRRQYVEAIGWYLDNTPYDIVFCENSGTDLSAHFANGAHGGRLEFLTYVKGGVRPEAKATRRWRSLSMPKPTRG